MTKTVTTGTTKVAVTLRERNSLSMSFEWNDWRGKP